MDGKRIEITLVRVKREAPRDQVTAMPSTSTFQAGLARPPMMSMLAGRCVPSTAERPARTEAISAGLRTIVVNFAKFLISITAARSCACKFRQANAHCASASSGTLPSVAVPTCPLRYHVDQRPSLPQLGYIGLPVPARRQR